MGRWGHTMFEGDADMDLKGEIEHDVSKLAGKEIDFFDRQQQQDIREILNGGVSKTLFAKYRVDKGWWSGYIPLVFAMLCMLVGADIDADDMAYLREAVNHVPSKHGYQLPIFDAHFRDQGKVQFIAAVEHYKNGEPRLPGPSCWACGKTSADIDHKLFHCKQCTDGLYCDKQCQKKDWKKHKRICVDKEAEAKASGRGFISMNV